MTIFYLYDRWDTQIDTLPEVESPKHKDELNGEDSLSFDIRGYNLEKGQRIVWRDKFGKWHEHVIVDIDTDHDEDGISATVFAKNSINELETDEELAEQTPKGTAAQLLSLALVHSRWTVGTVEVTGTIETRWYAMNPKEALDEIMGYVGGELETVIEVSNGKVTKRTLNLLNRRGHDLNELFTYGRNVTSINRVIGSEHVYTALYGYGKALQNYGGSGNEQRKTTFGEMNGGVNWVGDEAAKAKWGLPDGKGGKKHSFGRVEFSEVTDPRELMDLTKAALKESCKPQVTYSANILAFTDQGLISGADVQTGDAVPTRDKDLDERFISRAICVERDLSDESNTTLTIGTYRQTLTQKVDDQTDTVSSLDDRSHSWDDVVAAEKTWLDYFMDSVNSFMNQTGGFVYWEQGVGLTVYDKPVDKNPTMAIQLNGAGFRIANSKNPDGSWRWRTFGTGDGFTADLITAGTIQGGSNNWNLETGVLEFKQGKIQSANGKSVWDMSSNTFTTDSMTANNMTANGTFTCGTTTNGMQLTNDGKLAGYRNGSQVGYINYMGQIQDEQGRTRNGLLISGGCIGFDVNEIYLRNSSGGYYRGTSGSAQYQVMRNAWLDGEGALKITTGDILVGFINGLCTYFDVW